MNLNPLSTNYIHNLPFNRTKTRTPQSNQNKTSTIIKNKKPPQQEPIDKYEQASQKDQSNGYKTCQFALQEPRTTSHLIYCKEGYMFGITKREGKIEKRSIIVFPDGTFANCYVQGGRLNGWAVLCKKNSFYNIFQYKGSKLQGDQYIYDIKCGIMLRSNYINGRLNSIHKCSAQNQTKFQKFVNNKMVYNLLVQTLDCVFLKCYYPSIECTMGTYYGSKRGQIPFGVGVLVTDEEIFYGQFEEGLLYGYGTISYQDGNSYIGELQSGLTKGIGKYSRNAKIVYKYNETTVNQDIFNEYFELKSWEEDLELRSIYAPIISFYLKLRKIEIERKGEPESSQLSLVDVELGNEEEYPSHDGAQRKDSSSPAQTDRINTSFNKKNEQKEEYGGDTGRRRQNELSKTNNMKDQSSRIKIEIHENKPLKVEEQVILQPIKNAKKGGKIDKKLNKKLAPRQNNVLLNDNEWEQVIEELQAEQTVGREDAFLQPEKQSLLSSEKIEIYAKGNPLNSRQKRLDLTTLKKQDKQQGLQEPEQKVDKKINRVLPKTAKKP